MDIASVARGCVRAHAAAPKLTAIEVVEGHCVVCGGGATMGSDWAKWCEALGRVGMLSSSERVDEDVNLRYDAQAVVARPAVSAMPGLTSAGGPGNTNARPLPLRTRLLSQIVRPTPLPLSLGIVVAALLIVAETLVLYPLTRVASDSPWSAIYALGVLIVAIGWGFGLAAATSVASALAFNCFHMPPMFRFVPATVRDATTLGAFLVVALCVSTLASLARSHAAEADQRRGEAELAREQLIASRARIVAAGDEARRRLERDLHDGAQQRLVTLGLQLRSVEASVPAELHQLKDQISGIGTGLASLLEELQEISRGIHPAILSTGGLGPALKTLARRSMVPVRLDVRIQRRSPEHAEVAGYYVVAEALTNVAKHARASQVNVDVEADATNLRLAIRDDGIGGADAAKGSGLTGLRDRVEALGGTLTVSSQPGNGTSLLITIPCQAQTSTDSN
jgi:signal transduction histidine kinase